ncbi:MAG: class I SAM-dependent DNA methyltransferase [Candidatus Dadabacteria bacterium]|nr:class I SAM-dependent DNA methyltransferase [Candidatus Dadabacteria bacterium]
MPFMPPLSWNEIRARALAFSKEWKDETSEKAASQTFWDEFFEIFGVRRRRVASFEKHVKGGFIDLLWKGVLLVEHKSAGSRLDTAYSQALDYFSGLKESDLPRYIVVSDFSRFRLYDLEEDKEHEFNLKDLHKNINLFGFIAGYKTHSVKEQDPVNIRAAEQMGKLHDRMKEVGYGGHDLEVYLVRLLFCMFAEDTGIFELRQFQEYIENRTSEDGSDLGSRLAHLFDTLNKKGAERLKSLDEDLGAFPYVNGELFKETLAPMSFDGKMRNALLDCCALDWSAISPAIFGSLFQSIMDKEARRNLGAHYTSEENILKLINPLFMDDLRAEFRRVKKNKNRLFEFHKKLRTLNFLDPACGCGNFLVIAYRELRLLELEILRASNVGHKTLDIHGLVSLDVDQFYGIETEEFPAQIAQVALWLMDHQMNRLVSEEFGLYFARIPLKTSAKIMNGNALGMDWDDVIPAERLSFIMGNPPFVGHHLQSAEQKAEMLACYRQSKVAGVMDYVSAWYCKAVDYIADTDIKVAFVSTNSITQGEQVAPLWNELYSRSEVHIHFAHRTFKWSNEARGKAAVYCVIIGFGLQKPKSRRLFEYVDIKAEPSEIKARNINPYLVDAPNYFVESRRNPICKVTPMLRGSGPVDGGNLLLSEEEKEELIAKEPQAEKWIKPFLNAEEFLHNKPRYCLWLVDCPPNELRNMPLVMERVNAVKRMREASKKAPTREMAAMPTLFAEIRQSKSEYLLVPRHSSENRVYIPVGYMPPETICGDANFQIPDATLYDFGIFTSAMHNSWMRTVCGRLKSDYRYSNKLVYNNFPLPLKPTKKRKQIIEQKAQAVLDARAKFADSTLADLYDPLTMPPELLKAHQALDKAVDGAYGKGTFKTEAERVAFLFELYKQYTSPLTYEKKGGKKRRD